MFARLRTWLQRRKTSKLHWDFLRKDVEPFEGKYVVTDEEGGYDSCRPYPGYVFDFPGPSIVYRGPWILTPDIVKRIALWGILFDRVFISSYACIPFEGGRAYGVLQDVIALLEHDIIEPFSVNYHAYYDRLLKFLDIPHIPIYRLSDRHTWPAEYFPEGPPDGLPITARTKIYGQTQNTMCNLPMLATIYDLTDRGYRQLLMGKKGELARIRLGAHAQLYRRVWPTLSGHIGRHQKNLQRGFPKEAKLLERIRREVPVTIIDYAYYVNLSLHWMTVFQGAALTCDPEELVVYDYKRRRSNTKEEGGQWQDLPLAMEAYFNLPMFPSLRDVPVKTILQLRQHKGIEQWRSYLLELLEGLRVQSPQDGAAAFEVREFSEWLTKDIWARVSGELHKDLSMRHTAKRIAIDSTWATAGYIYPPLSALGFMGPVRDVYAAFNRDPILLFTVTADRMLREGN